MSKIKEISVNVSKKLGIPGEFSSNMVSASITVSVDEGDDIDLAYVGAWAHAWEEVNKQEEEIKSGRETKKVDPVVPVRPIVPDDPDPIMTATAPRCKVHNVPMVWRPAGVSKTTGKHYSGFYGCPEKNADGSFCKEKPEI